MSSEILTSARGLAMLGCCPAYYQTSRIFKSYLQVVGAELDNFKSGIQEVLDQFFVSTSDWDLGKWEEELGITTDTSKTDEQRRSTITGKLRGIGTVTFDIIESVANAYENGTVEIESHPETYSFWVSFVDILGIPPNLDDLQAAIEEIKPAHLAVVYMYTYTTWGDVNAAGKTWGQLNTLGLTWEDMKSYEPA